MDICIIGIGYVGAVTAACLAESGHKVIAVDTDNSKVEAINNATSPITEPKLDDLIKKHVTNGNLEATNDLAYALAHSQIFLICVGTPSKKNGSLDLTYIEKISSDIGAHIKGTKDYKTVVFRSTMLPGSTLNTCLPLLEKTSSKKAGYDFGIGTNPEFLREGTAVEDYFNPPKIVVGATNPTDLKQIMSIYDGIDAPRIETDIQIAEGVKYADNAWHALKVGFANELGNILNDAGLDSHKVMEIFCQDKKLNISDAYLKPGFAFGGSCLPKDVRAIKSLGHQMKLKTPLFDSLLSANDNQIDRAYKKIKDSNAKDILLLGLSFKSDTDDIRESPLVTLANKLIEDGLNLKIYDPNVYSRIEHKNFKLINKDHFVASISTQNINPDYIIIGNKNPTFKEIIEQFDNKAIPVLDLVRLDPNIEKRENYSGICW